MNADKARLTLLERQCELNYKGFKIVAKDESFWQRLIGFLMFWNRGYMKSYVSVFYPNVYWPTRKGYEEIDGGNKIWVSGYYDDPWVSFKILSHERVHLKDDKDNRGSFGFGYASPQIWTLAAVLGLLAIWFWPWGLFGLLPLLCAIPWPSPWRVKWELHGYAMNLAINYWKHGSIRDSTLEWIADQLTKSSYYFPSWSRKKMMKRLRGIVVDIELGKILEYGQVFRDVRFIVMASDRQVIDAAVAGDVFPQNQDFTE